MEILYDFRRELWEIAIDAEDNIFVANSGNYSIDKVSLNNGKVSITQSTKISSLPLALAINSKNEIYIATLDGEIMKMTKEGIISNIAGNGTRGLADGIGKNAKIGSVYGICFDENDIAYFCDYCNGRSSIRKLTPDGKVTTLCGGESGYSDGKGKQAKFSGPSRIVYNYSTKIFYITDCDNKSIRTMTVDGNVNTLCKYSDDLYAIAIDGEAKLYVSPYKDYNSREEGELITVDSKGEIKQMNIRVKNCRGMAFNSKGDLFFNSDNSLCVIRNCTKYPPHPILTPITNINTKETQPDIQESNKQLASTQKENQKLKEQLASFQVQLTSSQAEIQELKRQLDSMSKDAIVKETEKQKLINSFESENKSLKIKLQELEQKETKENGNEVFKWLSSIQLSDLFPIFQSIGVRNLEFLKFVEESDLNGTNIKPIEKKILLQSIKKLKEDSAIKVFQNNVNL